MTSNCYWKYRNVRYTSHAINLVQVSDNFYAFPLKFSERYLITNSKL